MDEERTLVAHLEDLRGVVLSSISVFGFCFVAFLLSIQHTIPLITQGRQLVMLSPLDVVRFYASVAGGLSLGVSAPFIGYRLWRFVRPALTAQESRAALTYIPAMFFSFVLGIAFGFFVVFPFAYRFLTGLGESHFTVMVTTQEYMSFLLMTTLPMGFLFEVPFVLMFLTATGMVTPDKLKAVRKYAYLLFAVVSAIVTPPEFVSQLLVLFPLFALYELGLVLTRWVYRKQQRGEGDMLEGEPVPEGD